MELMYSKISENKGGKGKYIGTKSVKYVCYGTGVKYSDRLVTNMHKKDKCRQMQKTW